MDVFESGLCVAAPARRLEFRDACDRGCSIR
jgi:hypothetical protein